MKRKNLIIDETLLKEAKRALGTDTESETVNRSLQEMVRILKVKELAMYFGSGALTHDQDDLAAMREDRPKSSSRKKRA